MWAYRAHIQVAPERLAHFCCARDQETRTRGGGALARRGVWVEWPVNWPKSTARQCVCVHDCAPHNLPHSHHLDSAEYMCIVKERCGVFDCAPPPKPLRVEWWHCARYVCVYVNVFVIQTHSFEYNHTRIHKRCDTCAKKVYQMKPQM